MKIVNQVMDNSKVCIKKYEKSHDPIQTFLKKCACVCTEQFLFRFHHQPAERLKTVPGFCFCFDDCWDDDLTAGALGQYPHPL